MEGGVGFVGVVRVEEVGWVVVDYALDEEEFVEEDGAAEARGDVDPAAG